MRVVRNVLFLLVGLLVGASYSLSYAATGGPVAAQWPSSSDAPTGKTGGGPFDCLATLTGGNVKWDWLLVHVTKPTGPSTNYDLPSHTFGFTQQWSDATTDHGCVKWVERPYCPPDYSWDGADLCNPSTPDQCAELAGKYDNGGNPQIVQLPIGDGAVYSGKLVDGKVPPVICIDSCEANPRAGYKYSAAYLGDGTFQLQGNPKYTGKQCMGTNTTPLQQDSKRVLPTTPEFDCVSKGQGFGYVNGAVVCTGQAKPSEEKAPTKTETKSNPDGTKTETTKDTKIECDSTGCTTTTTTTTTVINADGSRGASNTSTESTKSASGGGGTTVIGGNGGSGSSSDGKQAESTPFCAENPNSVICKQGSFSAGACGSEPSCSGDPVQCATARAVWKLECKTPSWGAPADDGRVVAEKKVGDDIVPITLSGASSCPSPRSVTVLGYSVSMAFDPVCQFAEGIRPVVIVVGWIAAAYIVLGRKTSGGSE